MAWQRLMEGKAMVDDKLAQEAHEALHDMIQWVAVFAASVGSHGVVLKSPRMAKAQAVLEKLERAAGVPVPDGEVK